MSEVLAIPQGLRVKGLGDRKGCPRPLQPRSITLLACRDQTITDARGGWGLGFRTCYTRYARLVYHPAQQSKGAGVLLDAGVQGCIS